MCGHDSFSATADTLQELVEIVSLHIRQVKAKNYAPHDQYFKDHPGTKNLMPGLEVPENTRAILASDLFSWSIERLVPFNEILKVAKVKPFPHLDQLIAPSTNR